MDLVLSLHIICNANLLFMCVCVCVTAWVRVQSTSKVLAHWYCCLFWRPSRWCHCCTNFGTCWIVLKRPLLTSCLHLLSGPLSFHNVFNLNSSVACSGSYRLCFLLPLFLPLSLPPHLQQSCNLADCPSPDAYLMIMRLWRKHRRHFRQPLKGWVCM